MHSHCHGTLTITAVLHVVQREIALSTVRASGLIATASIESINEGVRKGATATERLQSSGGLRRVIAPPHRTTVHRGVMSWPEMTLKSPGGPFSSG